MPTIPSLALVMIARNEARCIERCLLSARAFVDRMLVLDTGSTDDTIALATSCGAEVQRFAWSGDFSAARNRALALADADWNLVLDADEWLADGGAAVQAVRDSPPKLGVVMVKSDDESSGQILQNISWISRLLPRGVRYVGRVHEQPMCALPRVRLPVTLGHDGYNKQQMKRKRGRNRSLLLQALEREPANPYILYQLGKDHEAYGDPPAAANHYLRAFALISSDALYRHDLCVRLLYCLGKSGRIDQALTLAAELLDEWSDSPDHFFALRNLFLDRAIQDPEQALAQWLPHAQAAWLRGLDIGERPELDGTVLGRGSFLAAHNLAVLCEGTGDHGGAAHFHSLSKQFRESVVPESSKRPQSGPAP